MNRAACILIFVVSALALSAPAEAPQQDEAEGELFALVKEVRAQQAEIDANETKITEQIATLAETVRVARIYSSRGGR